LSERVAQFSYQVLILRLHLLNPPEEVVVAETQLAQRLIAFH
jgi:hypothetical protein